MNLLRAMSTVSAMTLLSRITGLARESLKAVVFGAGLQMDAFEAAFRLPNILRRLFAEGAFSQAFVPILAECRRQRGDDATRELFGKVGGLLALVLLAVSVLGVLVAPHVGPPSTALAWGVAVGGIAQLALQVRPLVKLGMLPRPRLVWRDPDVRRVLSAMGPALLGVSAAQISVLINTQLAALLGDGRISWITYADRLMEFPSALLGVALGTVLLPSLARHYHDANHGQYRELLDWGLRVTFLLAL